MSRLISSEMSFDEMLQKAQQLYHDIVKCVPVDTSSDDYNMFIDLNEDMVDYIMCIEEISAIEAAFKVTSLIRGDKLYEEGFVS